MACSVGSRLGGERTIAVLALGIALALAGCLRNQFDLCDRIDPHPECDAGPPSFDAGPREDAGDPQDAGMIMDSGDVSADAGPADAGSVPDDAMLDPDA